MRIAEQLAQSLTEAPTGGTSTMAIYHELNDLDRNQKAFVVIFNQLIRNYTGNDLSTYEEKLHQVNQTLVNLATMVGRDIALAKKEEREIWRQEK